MIILLPLMLSIGISIIGTAVLLQTAFRTQNERFNRYQALLLARSAIDIGPHFPITPQPTPPNWNNDALLHLSTALPIDVEGEIRVILTATDWIGIGKYQSSIAVLRRSTASTTSPIKLVPPD